MSVVSSTPAGGGVNYVISNGTDTLLMRIDSDVNVGPLPPFFRAIGIGSQFDTDTPYDDGYQFLPRSAADIIPVTSTFDPGLKASIKAWPNPVTGQYVMLDTEVQLERIVVCDLFGRLLHAQKGQMGIQQIDLGALPAGTYLLKVESAGRFWSTLIIKH